MLQVNEENKGRAGRGCGDEHEGVDRGLSLETSHACVALAFTQPEKHAPACARVGWRAQRRLVCVKAHVAENGEHGAGFRGCPKKRTGWNSRGYI